MKTPQNIKKIRDFIVKNKNMPTVEYYAVIKSDSFRGTWLV